MITEALLNSMMLRLGDKIDLLQAHSRELSAANGQLETERNGLQKLLDQQREKNRELQKKLDQQKETFTIPSKISKIVKKNQADAVDHTELKQKLDEYIREIEQLIAHLSTLS